MTQQKQCTYSAPSCPPPAPGPKVCEVLEAYLESVHLPANIKVIVLCSLLLLHTDNAISIACQARGQGALGQMG